MLSLLIKIGCTNYWGIYEYSWFILIYLVYFNSIESKLKQKNSCCYEKIKYRAFAIMLIRAHPFYFTCMAFYCFKHGIFLCLFTFRFYINIIVNYIETCFWSWQLKFIKLRKNLHFVFSVWFLVYREILLCFLISHIFFPHFNFTFSL